MNRWIGAVTLASAAVALCVESAVAAGEWTNIQGMGMARTFVGSSRGLDAVGLNPANLAVPGRGTVTVGLMPFGAQFGIDFMTYDLYEEYFTGEKGSGGRIGRLLTDADKRTLLASFPDGVGRGSAHVEARPIGVFLQLHEYGNLAFTITEYGSMNFMIPQDFAKFLLYGNPPGSSYDFSQTSAQVMWLREYALTYARELPTPVFVRSLSAGVAVKVIHGFGCFEIERANTRFTTGLDGILHGNMDFGGRMAGIDPIRGGSDAAYQPFPAPAGTGWGLDLGIASDITRYLRAGVSITDIGSVEWTRNLEQVVSSGTVTVDNPLEETQRDSLEDAVTGERIPGMPFSTPLTTMFRVGAAVELHKVPVLRGFLWGEWMFACDFNIGLVDGAAGPQTGRLSMGLEFKPWGFLPLRTGVSFGGPDRYSFALGMGFHFGVFDLDLASEHLNFLFSEAALDHGAVAMGMRIGI
jgi:hypothetical protein